jgi:2-polyprenyl-6-methoxyphenol hydroxylase-like FAD-dependent oxidoreductase
MTESILDSAAAQFTNILHVRGVTIQQVERGNDRVAVSGTDAENSTVTAEGRFLIGADGAKSAVRAACGIKFFGAAYPHTFVMADFPDSTGWGTEARLYFSRYGSVESFPLPGAYRRFVVRTASFVDSQPAAALAAELPRRCGVKIDKSAARWETAFGVQRFIAATFALPRLFLCGDAAHVMSPIGGQNMNVGFADAELAAWSIDAILRSDASPASAAQIFNRIRRKSTAAAAGRAELMMRMGTSGGAVWNLLRNSAMSIALRTPLAAVANGMFTMLSLPNRDLPSCRRQLDETIVA